MCRRHHRGAHRKTRIYTLRVEERGTTVTSHGLLSFPPEVVCVVLAKTELFPVQLLLESRSASRRGHVHTRLLASVSSCDRW